MDELTVAFTGVVSGAVVGTEDPVPGVAGAAQRLARHPRGGEATRLSKAFETAKAEADAPLPAEPIEGATA